MSDPQLPEKNPSEPASFTKEQGGDQARSVKTPSKSDAGDPAIGEPKPVEELTPEEQMARFEKELKEDDWGHQPC